MEKGCTVLYCSVHARNTIVNEQWISHYSLWVLKFNLLMAIISCVLSWTKSWNVILLHYSFSDIKDIKTMVVYKQPFHFHHNRNPMTFYLEQFVCHVRLLSNWAQACLDMKSPGVSAFQSTEKGYIMAWNTNMHCYNNRCSNIQHAFFATRYHI